MAFQRLVQCGLHSPACMSMEIENTQFQLPLRVPYDAPIAIILLIRDFAAVSVSAARVMIQALQGSAFLRYHKEHHFPTLQKHPRFGPCGSLRAGGFHSYLHSI